MGSLLLALRLAWRDLRGPTGGAWILLVGIALGVACMAAVGGVAGAVLDGVRAGARESVGGDVSLRLFHRAPNAEERSFLEASGTLSLVAELRPVVRRADGTRPVLVELKAIDAAYPLYGRLVLEPAVDLAGGAAVDAALLGSLGIGLGDRIRIGAAEVEVRALVVEEPDRALRAFELGPRVIVGRAVLEASGLAPEGSQVYWYSRLGLPGEPAAWIREAEARFPDAGWRIVNAEDGVPGVERTVEIAQVLLALVSLSVLLIGGVGVGSAVAAHLGRRTRTIAVLKALGAGGRLVHAVYLVQVLGLAGMGILAGLALGAPAPWLAARLMPFARAGIQPGALLAAAGFGVLTALAFSLGPLARAAGTPPQGLFRSLVAPVEARRPWLSVGAAGAALLALLLLVTEVPVLAAVFAVGAGAAAVAFLLLGRGVAWAARRSRGAGGASLRLALGNVARPGAATVPVVTALGLGLTVLVAVATVERNAARYLAGGLPESAPDLVFINLPPGAPAPFEGAERVQRMPFLHGRVTHLEGAPVHGIRVPRDAAWVVRGDRGVSWAGAMPEGTTLTAGRWWDPDHRGRPLASVDAAAARRLGLDVGDRLTLNLLGRPVEAEVANLRAVDWSRLGLDFPVLLSPPATPLPHTEVAAVWARDPDAVEAAVAAALPESPAVRVAPVIARIGAAVEAAGTALSAASAVTVLAALAVLAGAVAASYRRRLDEMVTLKVVGARPAQLARAAVLEFALLGSAAAVPAGLLGTAAGYAAVRAISPEAWEFAAAVPLGLGAAAVAVTAGTGWLLARRLLARPSAEALRGLVGG